MHCQKETHWDKEENVQKHFFIVVAKVIYIVTEGDEVDGRCVKGWNDG